MPLYLITLIYVGVGILFIGFAVPLVQQRIKPNWWYGFRTTSTVTNPALWYPVNVYGGRLMLIWGGFMIAGAIILAVLPDMDANRYVLLTLVAIVVGAIGFVGLMLRYLHVTRRRLDHEA